MPSLCNGAVGRVAPPVSRYMSYPDLRWRKDCQDPGKIFSVLDKCDLGWSDEALATPGASNMHWSYLLSKYVLRNASLFAKPSRSSSLQDASPKKWMPLLQMTARTIQPFSKHLRTSMTNNTRRSISLMKKQVYYIHCVTDTAQSQFEAHQRVRKPDLSKTLFFARILTISWIFSATQDLGMTCTI